MLKKVLLSIMLLTAMSEPADAKGIRLSRGQKRCLTAVFGTAAAAFSVYCVFVFNLAKIKCSKVYDHIIYWHCDKSPHDKECKKECEKYDFEKNKFLNLEEADLEKLKNGKLDLLHVDRIAQIIAIKTESENSYKPIEITQFTNDNRALAIDEASLDKQISKSEKNKMTFARFGDAFIHWREVAYHGKKLVAQIAQNEGFGKEKK